MRYKAVLFDLFETLITEWGHKKYTKKEMSSDLGVESGEFDLYWEEKDEERYLGQSSFEDSVLYVCEKLGKTIDNPLLVQMLDKRMKTKAACFEAVDPAVYRLLECIRERGMKTAIISNCSAEEVTVLQQSRLYTYFDTVVLSCEVHMKKPDLNIYEEATQRLGVLPEECAFVGDGGSNELSGAKAAGMTAIQAKWYTNQWPYPRGDFEGVFIADDPTQVMEYITR